MTTDTAIETIARALHARGVQFDVGGGGAHAYEMIEVVLEDRYLIFGQADDGTWGFESLDVDGNSVDSGVVIGDVAAFIEQKVRAARRG